MEQSELIPHLFRTEFSKIIAVLCNYFGFKHIEIAEDIASDTFLSAFETWTYKGVPENPKAWLYFVAKNKAKNHIQRDRIFKEKVIHQLDADLSKLPEIDLSEKNISDSQLQMLFVVCHPSLSNESQISLALRVLCGFGIDEIAAALLSQKETINKRLLRAKEKLRSEKVKIEFPEKKEIQVRLENVLTTLYLLFNEGYYSESRDSILREDLCFEAMRLIQLLLDNESTNTTQTNALFSLMCFQSSRFEARKNKNGELVLYSEQDETLWDQKLISKGAYHLHKASQGNILSKYHLEASIAYWHTIKEDMPEKWQNILQLFDHLLQIEYSPIAALNRTYAFSKIYGNAKAILEAEKLALNSNHFYYTLLGELYKTIDKERSKENFLKALTLAKTEPDRKTIQNKMDEL